MEGFSWIVSLMSSDRGEPAKLGADLRCHALSQDTSGGGVAVSGGVSVGRYSSEK